MVEASNSIRVMGNQHPAARSLKGSQRLGLVVAGKASGLTAGRVVIGAGGLRGRARGSRSEAGGAPTSVRMEGGREGRGEVRR